MLKKLLTIGLLALSTLGAHARMGWTLEQCDSYYGPHQVGESGHPIYYMVGQFRFSTYFKNGVVAHLFYQKLATAPLFSEADAFQILTLSGGKDTVWKPEGRYGRGHVAYIFGALSKETEWVGYQNGKPVMHAVFEETPLFLDDREIDFQRATLVVETTEMADKRCFHF